ncbi:hypothetical protein FFW70_01995 [Escherichia coli]|nr:hypothetical protein [Escherichia coli]EFD0540707.1 hypothetical protein [Escherichia coli]EFD0602095.1 hypothetical protein [Escherichia coli]MIA04635.1 hypothetical protein [Escherichia coli]QDX43234.1 hypothetical protein FQU84_07440 [Escherichia coli]
MNSIQGGSGPIKKPASAGFNVIGSRDSVAYPFLSPHRLVGVLLRLITSCFCWCSPYTVQSWRELKPQPRRMQERAAVGW